MSKASAGNFFEDFSLGQTFLHPTPRTVGEGDIALYLALTGSRHVIGCAAPVAHALGYPRRPLDDLLAFHLAFGKTVSDISLNAVANLGYADVRFLAPVYVGDTLAAESVVIGLKENSTGESGVVWVRSTAVNQDDKEVLTWIRWVMVKKRDRSHAAPKAVVPETPVFVAPQRLAVPAFLDARDYETRLTGGPWLWDDYEVDERVDHPAGMTLDEPDHTFATRLYQNTAKVHFNQHSEAQGRFGRRLIYGGHVISLARALSFNGLANAFHIAAINGGRHVAPLFAGGTVYAWSEILATAELPGRSDVGALRILTRATRDVPCAEFPVEDGTPDKPGVILELDYWALMVR